MTRGHLLQALVLRLRVVRGVQRVHVAVVLLADVGRGRLRVAALHRVHRAARLPSHRASGLRLLGKSRFISFTARLSAIFNNSVHVTA